MLTVHTKITRASHFVDDGPRTPDIAGTVVCRSVEVLRNNLVVEVAWDEMIEHPDRS